MSCADEPLPPLDAPNPCGGYYCSEEHGHIDCQRGRAQTSMHMDCEPGLTMQGTTIQEVTTLGQHYFKATAQIGSIFGSDVEGELVGLGRTKEQALENLAKERKKLYDSLWA